MYFLDSKGLIWMKDGDVFRNVGISIREKTVSFKTIDTISVVPSPVTVIELPDAVPTTIRDAIGKLHITELSPLEPLKNITRLEV